MKKYLLGTVAVALAIGFSAFTKPSNEKSSEKATDYYFRISNSYGLGMPVNPGDATFLSTSNPGNPGCSGSSKQCVSRFTESQVNTLANPIVLNGTQTPQATTVEKN